MYDGYYTKRYKLHIENLLNANKTLGNTCATAYTEETGETALTAWYTHTLCQPADNQQMSGEVGDTFSLHTL